jgi:DNA polymerase-3 subunit gamma/tau
MGLSINATLKNEVKEDSEEETNDDTAPNPELPKDDFDTQSLINIWNEYLEIVKSEGRQKIFSSLSNKPLEVKENFVVELKLENEIQQSFFNEEKPELMRFIRQKLNNFSLQFDIKITKDKQVLEPYSPQEKFEYMVKKNPHLLELKRRLDLDIE